MKVHDEGYHSKVRQKVNLIHLFYEYFVVLIDDRDIKTFFEKQDWYKLLCSFIYILNTIRRLLFTIYYGRYRYFAVQR